MNRRAETGDVLALTFLGLVVASLPCCRADSPPGGQPIELRHPIKSAVLSNSTDVPVNDLDFATLEGALPGRFGLIREFPDSSAVGLLDGDPNLVLGKILDAAIVPASPQPTVALLDGSYGIVRIFDMDGSPRSSFGGFGSGPGEITSPVALEYSNDTAMVLDAGLKVERYVRKGSVWEPLDCLRLPVDAQDLCPLDDGLAVLGLRLREDGRPDLSLGSSVIHVLSQGYREIRASFSEPYRYNASMALWFVVRGKLTCDRSQGALWVAYERLHEVHAFGPNRDLLWISRLTDMTSPDLIETERRSIRSDGKDPHPIELITHVSLLQDSLLAVQVMSVFFGPTGPGRPGNRDVSYRTYLIDSKSGHGVGAFRGTHQIIGGGKGQIVLYREDPFPQFALVDIGRG